LEQVERLDVEFLGQPLDHAQTRIAFATFESADIRAVDPEQLGELFLRQLALDAQPTQVASQRLLQSPDHHSI
jgi:hypothetical protein